MRSRSQLFEQIHFSLQAKVCKETDAERWQSVPHNSINDHSYVYVKHILLLERTKGLPSADERCLPATVVTGTQSHSRRPDSEATRQPKACFFTYYITLYVSASFAICMEAVTILISA